MKDIIRRLFARREPLIPFRLSTSIRMSLKAAGWPDDAAKEAADEAVAINGKDERVTLAVHEDLLMEVARVD